jgi:hypothetical protein
MPPPATDSVTSTTTLQLSPTIDGIRVHSLGILSTIVRHSFVPLASKANITTLLADVLDLLLPKSVEITSRLNTLQISDSTSMDAMIVAINGIIDTFADETSAWDSIYNQLRLQSRLKRASLDVKSAVSRVRCVLRKE